MIRRAAFVALVCLCAVTAHAQQKNAEPRKYPGDLLKTVNSQLVLDNLYDTGVYCGANTKGVPQGWVRIARLKMIVGNDEKGGCVHDIYVNPCNIIEVFPLAKDVATLEKIIADRKAEIARLDERIASLRGQIDGRLK